MRAFPLGVLASIAAASTLLSTPLAAQAQRALTIGFGVGEALVNASARDRSGLELNAFAEQRIDRTGWFALRFDAMLVDWRVGHPAALDANAVLYANPTARTSPYIIGGAGVYGIGAGLRGGGNIGLGVRLRGSLVGGFAEFRVHSLHNASGAIPVLTVGVRF